MKAYLILFFFIFYSCSSSEENRAERNSGNVVNRHIEIPKNKIEDEQKNITDTLKQNVKSQSTYSFSIIKSDIGYGYEILYEGKVMIRQPHIPAVQGNQGFISSIEAEKVANLVVDKLSRGVSPPSVSTEELDKIGIKYK
jgi:hypothetical protein